MKALRALTHHHHETPRSASVPTAFSNTEVASSAPRSTSLTPIPPVQSAVNRSIISRHLRDNEPPLRAASFSAFANDQLAAEHGYADPATYFILVLSPPFTFERIQSVVRGMVPELEPFEEQDGALLSLVDNKPMGSAVKAVRIRGSVRGWWTVLQGVLEDEEGRDYYLKRVRTRVQMEGGTRWEGDGYQATKHFPEEKRWRNS